MFETRYTPLTLTARPPNAVSSGRPAASSELNVMNRMTNAITMPTPADAPGFDEPEP